MYWLHLTKTQKKRITRLLSTAEVQDPFAEQSESLRWTALMITGSSELAERSIIDATGLAETSSCDFRDWLVLWAHLATARAALNAVRSSIQETAKRYAEWTCSHHSHEHSFNARNKNSAGARPQSSHTAARCSCSSGFGSSRLSRCLV